MALNSDTQITSKVDYLSTTIRSIKYPNTWDNRRAEMKRGMLGYDVGVTYMDGRIELCSSTRADMLPHVIFSGKCIDKLCLKNGGDTMSVLRAMAAGRASRIDIAVDIKGGTLNISELRDEFADGNAATLVKKGLYLEGVGILGETLYVGAAGSKRRMRVYNKAAEMGLNDVQWTRVEFQMRGRDAARCFDVLIHADRPYSLIPKLIVGFVDFPQIADWIIAMGTEKLKPSPIDAADSNREKWLMDTAVKALASEMLEGGKGMLLMRQFRTAVVAEFERKKTAYK